MMFRLIWGLCICCLWTFTMMAGSKWSGKQSDWKGYPKISFKVSGQDCYVILPKEVAEGHPWVWRARWPNYHIEPDLLLLERGFHIAYIDAAGMLGSDRALGIWDQFYQKLTENNKLSKRVNLVAVSRGGLFAYRWASKNASLVNSIYADVPVCDFKSWPLGQGEGIGSPKIWEELLKEYKFSHDEALVYQHNPIDVLKPLAKNKIPFLNLVSLNDKVVPPTENTFVLAERYRALGGEIEIMIVEKGEKSNGHHFAHPNPEKVSQFILKHLK